MDEVDNESRTLRRTGVTAKTPTVWKQCKPEQRKEKKGKERKCGRVEEILKPTY